MCQVWDSLPTRFSEKTKKKTVRFQRGVWVVRGSEAKRAKTRNRRLFFLALTV